MRFRCTAKVERYEALHTDQRELYRVRVGCLPLHEVVGGDPFRALDVVVTWRTKNPRWEDLGREARHQRIESFVRSWVRKRGVEWVSAWAKAAIERIELDQHPLDLTHDDPGDPFDIEADR